MNFLDVLPAIRVCDLIAHSPAKTFQFGAKVDSDYVSINADKFQLIYWILHTVGFQTCVAELRKCYGMETEEQRAAEKRPGLADGETTPRTQWVDGMPGWIVKDAQNETG